MNVAPHTSEATSIAALQRQVAEKQLALAERELAAALAARTRTEGTGPRILTGQGDGDRLDTRPQKR